MRHLTREEFDARFPRRPPAQTLAHAVRQLVVERDTAADGDVYGDVTVRRSNQVTLAAVVYGWVSAEYGGAVYLTGTGDVLGNVWLARGAGLCVEGVIEGKVRGALGSFVCNTGAPPRAGVDWGAVFAHVLMSWFRKH